MGRLIIRLMGLMMITLGIWLAESPVLQAEEVPHVKVRAGFFAFDGYHMMDADGGHNGYGYEVLQLMARYMNWEYEYIGYDRSWGQMLAMLQDGEIDLLTSAQKTPERLADFDFSARSIGTSATIFSVKAGNEAFVVGDYASYDGARVGMLYGSSRNEDFARFAAAHGFSYVPVYFSSEEELTQALQTGREINAIVTSNLRSSHDEWILEEFNPSPFYVIVRKGNAKLLEQVDYALSQLDIYSPEWRSELRQKFYSQGNNRAIAFSVEERAYLRSLDLQNKVLRVAMNPDMEPYSFFADGKAAGILPDLFAEAASRAGIRYEVVPVSDRDGYEELLREGRADIVMGMPFDYSAAERYGYEITSPFVTVAVAQITRKDFSDDVHSLAVPVGELATRLAANESFSGKEIQVLPSIEACLEAVLQHRVDGACLAGYSAQLQLRKDLKNQLRFTLLPGVQLPIRVGVSRAADYRLLSALSKSIDSVSGTPLIQNAVMKHTMSMMQSKPSLERFFYANPIVSAVIILLLALLLAGFVFLRQRAAAAQRENERRQEFERFLGYVCRANDVVLETDIQHAACRRYLLQDGNIAVQEYPYDIEAYLARIHPEDRAAVCALATPAKLDHMIDTDGEIYFECRMRPWEGNQYFWYAHTLQAIPKSPQHPHSFILLRHSIDETKKAEEEKQRTLQEALETARQASEAKGSFLSRMSHEIRTPLNAIIGYLTIARLPDSNAAKVQHCLASSDMAARHLLQIINDVLDISAIESGRIQIAAEPFNLEKLLTSLSTVFYSQAQAKKVQFISDVHGVSRDCFVGDALRLNQVLMNLLSNAVKFTPAGGQVTLLTEQAKETKDGVLMKFTVRDTGIGMNEEYLSRIFQPFEQESAKTAQQFGGTGLGLSISKNLVTLMQGSIEVTSRVHEGSSFTVTLPLRYSADKDAAALAPKDFSGLRALVVDDEKDDGEYICTLLGRCQVKADAALSGQDALLAVKKAKEAGQPYDFCILDWKMPDMDGLETARRLRAECRQDMLIIIATAYDVNTIEAEAKEAGVDRVLAKPLFPSTIFNLLVTYFGEAAKEPSAVLPALPDAMPDMHILMAEDNEMNREIAVTILSEIGLEVDTAVDGQDAVKKFLAAPPETYQAIFMDIQMPVMNGYEATKAIRASAHPRAKSIPIIAVTADVFSEDVARALACGMDDCISKPIDYRKLMEALSRYTKQKGAGKL